MQTPGPQRFGGCVPRRVRWPHRQPGVEPWFRAPGRGCRFPISAQIHSARDEAGNHGDPRRGQVRESRSRRIRSRTWQPRSALGGRSWSTSGQGAEGTTVLDGTPVTQ
jgi:hypothetical protein